MGMTGLVGLAGLMGLVGLVSLVGLVGLMGLVSLAGDHLSMLGLVLEFSPLKITTPIFLTICQLHF